MSGKELFIRFTPRAFRKLLSIYVFRYFRFGFEGRIWELIVSVRDHCLSLLLCDPKRSKDIEQVEEICSNGSIAGKRVTTGLTEVHRILGQNTQLVSMIFSILRKACTRIKEVTSVIENCILLGTVGSGMIGNRDSEGKREKIT